MRRTIARADRAVRTLPCYSSNTARWIPRPIALRAAQCGADIPDIRARLERAVAALCAGRPHDRRVALGCLPLGVAIGVDDPTLLHRGPVCVETGTLMRRCAKRTVPLDKATDMARALWAGAAAASEQLIASTALWFAQ